MNTQYVISITDPDGNVTRTSEQMTREDVLRVLSVWLESIEDDTDGEQLIVTRIVS